LLLIAEAPDEVKRALNVQRRRLGSWSLLAER
jgi:hypothetical protein